MYFTQEDYRCIQNWLQRHAVKDTEIPLTDEIHSNKDSLVIVQNNKNYRIGAIRFLSTVIDNAELNSLSLKTLNADLANVKKLIVESFETKGELIDGYGNNLNDTTKAAKGWSIKQIEPTSEETNVVTKYALTDYNGEYKGDFIKIYKNGDTFVADVYSGTIDDTVDSKTGIPNKKPITESNKALCVILHNGVDSYTISHIPSNTFIDFNFLKVWTGSNAISKLGTIAEGVWEGTPIADAFIASASKWNAKQDALTDTDGSYGQRIKTIESKIPADTTSENPLTNKEFVNSSIATNTATFRGTYTNINQFPLTGVDDNDYVFLKVMDTEEPTQVLRYDRYKWNGTGWTFEYSLNNSSFTSEQWTAINSGITPELIEIFNNKQDLISDLDEIRDNANKGAIAYSWGEHTVIFDKLKWDEKNNAVYVGDKDNPINFYAYGSISSGGFNNTSGSGGGTVIGIKIGDSDPITPIDGILNVPSDVISKSLGLKALAFKDILSVSDIPNLDISKINGLQSVLNTFNAHIDNKIIHITADERAVWNKIASIFGVDDSGDIYIKSDENGKARGFYTSSFISSGGKNNTPGTSVGTVIGIRVDSDTILEPTNGIVDMSDVLANIDVDLSNYYTKQETTSEIAKAVTNLNLGQYAKASELDTHIGNSTIHITATERTTWNNKYDKPASGIPYADLADGVKSALDKAHEHANKTSVLDKLKWDEAKNAIYIGDENNHINFFVYGGVASGGFSSTGGTGGGTVVGATVGGIDVELINGVLEFDAYPTTTSLGLKNLAFKDSLAVADIVGLQSALSNKQDAATAITTSNIGSQSVNYATSADLLDGYHADSFAKKLYLGTTDLNSIGDSLLGQQNSTERATTELHYPVQEAGGLISIMSTYDSTNQIYGTHSSNRWFARGSGSGLSLRTSWREFAFLDSNVVSSSKWATPRAITLTGSVTGSVSIDGSGDVSLATTTNHTHSFASLTSKPTTISGYGITDALTTANYNTYAPTLTGGGASGTWGINISGNAATATNALQLNGHADSYFAAASSLGNYLPLKGGNITGNLTVQNNTVYHSGNCNNTSTPWSCSNLTASGNATIAGNVGIGTSAENGSRLVVKQPNASIASSSASLTLDSEWANWGYQYNMMSFCFAGVEKAVLGWNSVPLSASNDAGFHIANRVSGDAINLLNEGGIYMRGSTTFGDSGARLYIHGCAVGFNRNTEVGGRYDTSMPGFQFHIDKSEQKLWLGCESDYGWLTCVRFSQHGDILATGAITAGTASDSRLKSNIATLVNASSVLRQLRGVGFEWNALATDKSSYFKGHDVGLIAQEVEPLIPSAIGTIWGEYKRLDYTKITPYLVEGWKAHDEEIQRLKTKIKQLEERIYGLEKQ